MDLKELIKIICLLVLFGLIAPLLGLALKGKRTWQSGAFLVMCVMMLGGFMGPGSWGLTLQSIEYYRGHSRGFHFYFNAVPALALIIAQALDQRKEFRWLPPGLWLYLVYCAVSLLTIVSAPVPAYVCMAAFKALEMTVFFVATYNFLRTGKDLRFFLNVMCGAMTWELFVVLVHKYVQGKYQISGTFEHQNSLTMFAGMIGMVFLALSLSPTASRWKQFLFCYLACAAIVVSALSRGGLAAFALGTAGAIGVVLLRGPTARQLAVIGMLGLVGVIGLAIALDSIIARFTMAQNVVGSQGRSVLKQCAWEMFKDYPFGIGWNNFARVMNPPFRYGARYDQWTISRGYSVDPNEARPVVESLYWVLLAETGIQSLVAYIALICLFLSWNLKAAFFFRGQFLGSVSLGIALGCGINYVHSFLERVLVFEKNMMLWLVMLAVTARIETWRRAELRRRTLGGAVSQPAEIAQARAPAGVVNLSQR